MNRRGFLKRCSILPFVGSLAVAGKAGATEGKLTKQDEYNHWRVEHCNIECIVQSNRKLYANIHNNKGEIVADYMPTRETKGIYQVFMPKLENGRYTVHVYEENIGVLLLVREKIVV